MQNDIPKCKKLTENKGKWGHLCALEVLGKEKVLRGVWEKVVPSLFLKNSSALQHDRAIKHHHAGLHKYK